MEMQENPISSHKRIETKLPRGWIRCHDDVGNKYYLEEESGESSWIAPDLPLHSRELTILPKGWTSDFDVENNAKFYIAPSGASQWVKPEMSSNDTAKLEAAAGHVRKLTGYSMIVPSK